jgi:putative nucleotidyltransferase with HDIG domain
VTALVVVLPLVLAATLEAAGLVTSPAALLAGPVVLSLAIASFGGLWWRHACHCSHLSFGDMMLWRGVSRRRLEAELRRSVENWPELRSLTAILAESDPHIYEHSHRVARHAAFLARAHGLSQAEVVRVHAAALVHDIGKVCTPRAILSKPSPLDERERAVLRDHANVGAEMVASLGDPELVAMVRHHHERPDGTGYPGALRGEEIPLGARILSVADVFDALVSDRPYRAAMSHGEALAELAAEAGSGVDAELASRFRRDYSGGREVIGWAAGLATLRELLMGVRLVPADSLGAAGTAAAGLAAATIALAPAPLTGPTAPHSKPPVVSQAHTPAIASVDMGAVATPAAATRGDKAAAAAPAVGLEDSAVSAGVAEPAVGPASSTAAAPNSGESKGQVGETDPVVSSEPATPSVESTQPAAGEERESPHSPSEGGGRDGGSRDSGSQPWQGGDSGPRVGTTPGDSSGWSGYGSHSGRSAGTGGGYYGDGDGDGGWGGRDYGGEDHDGFDGGSRDGSYGSGGWGGSQSTYGN